MADFRSAAPPGLSRTPGTEVGGQAGSWGAEDGGQAGSWEAEVVGQAGSWGAIRASLVLALHFGCWKFRPSGAEPE